MVRTYGSLLNKLTYTDPVDIYGLPTSNLESLKLKNRFIDLRKAWEDLKEISTEPEVSLLDILLLDDELRRKLT